jgi:hypothetical protein
VLAIRHVGDELRGPIGIAVQLLGQSRVGLLDVTCSCLDKNVRFDDGLRVGLCEHAANERVYELTVRQELHGKKDFRRTIKRDTRPVL